MASKRNSNKPNDEAKLTAEEQRGAQNADQESQGSDSITNTPKEGCGHECTGKCQCKEHENEAKDTGEDRENKDHTSKDGETPEMKGMPMGKFIDKLIGTLAEHGGAKVVVVGGPMPRRCEKADTCEKADSCPMAQVIDATTPEGKFEIIMRRMDEIESNNRAIAKQLNLIEELLRKNQTPVSAFPIEAQELKVSNVGPMKVDLSDKEYHRIKRLMKHNRKKLFRSIRKYFNWKLGDLPFSMPSDGSAYSMHQDSLGEWVRRIVEETVREITVQEELGE